MQFKFVAFLLFAAATARVEGIIPLRDFYPYGPSNGDATLKKNDDSYQGPISIKVSFPFFSGRYSSIFVNTNGALSFRAGVSAFTPKPFPVGGRMLTAFWADVDTTEYGEVYYRESQDRTLLERVSKDIRNNFPNLPNYKATWMYITTWYDVTFFGGSSYTPRNTFQCILSTNGVNSFAIFLYNDIRWTTGTHSTSGGNSRGLGGIPAQVGFNAGDNVNYFAVSSSRTSAIVDIETTSNVGVAGKWMFRVDKNDIQGTKCDYSGRADLTVSPPRVQLKGGDTIYISGPCFSKDMDIKCKFGNVIVSGTFESKFRVSCVIPKTISNIIKPGQTLPIGVATSGGSIGTGGTGTGTGTGTGSTGTGGTGGGRPVFRNITTPVRVDCNSGYWGPPSCLNRCRACSDGTVCDPVTGGCPTSCPPGRTNPPACDQVCRSGTFGDGCTFRCNCRGESCHPETGECPFGTGNCPRGTFGPTCNDTCRCKTVSKCDQATGRCSDGLCQIGYSGSNCQSPCPSGTYGQNCQQRCHCVGSCDPVSGRCNGACAAGWRGRPYCKYECLKGDFGVDCLKKCRCRKNDPCNRVTGECPGRRCAPGGKGRDCREFSCQGLPPGRYAHPTECHKHFLCTGVTVMKCPIGYRWDATNKRCSLNNFVRCSQSSSAEYECQDHAFGENYPDPRDCNRYYTCSADTVFACSYRQHWNQTTHSCEAGTITDCEDGRGNAVGVHVG